MYIYKVTINIQEYNTQWHHRPTCFQTRKNVFCITLIFMLPDNSSHPKTYNLFFGRLSYQIKAKLISLSLKLGKNLAVWQTISLPMCLMLTESICPTTRLQSVDGANRFSILVPLHSWQLQILPVQTIFRCLRTN